MCTGRIDPATVAGAFKKGVDGIMVVGCYFGDCHYITGNHQAQAKMNMTQKLLAYNGMNPERVRFAQCSSGEASRLVELVTEFQGKIRELGPLGSGSDKFEGEALTRKLEVAEHEGVIMQYLAAPVEILGENGKVTGMKCIKMELGACLMGLATPPAVSAPSPWRDPSTSSTPPPSSPPSARPPTWTSSKARRATTCPAGTRSRWTPTPAPPTSPAPSS